MCFTARTWISKLEFSSKKNQRKLIALIFLENCWRTLNLRSAFEWVLRLAISYYSRSNRQLTHRDQLKPGRLPYTISFDLDTFSTKHLARQLFLKTAIIRINSIQSGLGIGLYFTSRRDGLAERECSLETPNQNASIPLNQLKFLNRNTKEKSLAALKN